MDKSGIMFLINIPLANFYKKKKQQEWHPGFKIEQLGTC